MKINDVEKLLGITKANIRFYEKEGLLTPGRSENGYREYSDDDIIRLKQIVILRKLGIPVQQIEDILDGALPLQEALDANIRALNEEIEKLNGSLALCRQLKNENAETLDTDRYWQLIQSQEALGLQFHALLDDYLKFTEVNYAWFLWPLPGESLRKPWKVGLYMLIFSAVLSMTQLNRGEGFFPAFIMRVVSMISGLLIWTAIFIPIYLYSKRNKKAADRIMNTLLIAAPIAVVLALCFALYMAFNT